MRFLLWLLAAGLLAAACAMNSATHMDVVHDALARNDDHRAFSHISYAVNGSDEAQAQAAMAKLASTPRLQAAMQAALPGIELSTSVGVPSREAYDRDMRRRAEVQTYFRFRQMDSAQQARYLDEAWQRASEWKKEQLQEAAAAEALAQAERDREKAERDRQAAVFAALAREASLGSRFTCSTDAECRKAFALAQIYVSTMTDMKIQLATDTIVETYNPTEAGKMGAKVIKTPGAGQSAEIVITVTCRECSQKLRASALELMRDFRPFVEARLRQ